MNKNDEEEFFDAIGDEAQIREIQDRVQSRDNSMNQTNIFVSEIVRIPQNDRPSEIQADTVDTSMQAPAEKSVDLSDASRSYLAGLGQKVSLENPLQMQSKASNKSKFFALLNRKQSEDLDFPREAVKQHKKDESNFNNLTCLQYVDDEKRQDSSAKKAKGVSSTWIAKFSPDNKFLATGGSDGVLRIFIVTIMDEKYDPTETNLQVINPDYFSLTGHKFDIVDISWFKDSNLILTSSIDKTVILWNIANQSVVKIFEHSDIVSCVSFHPMVDEFFASGCFDKMIRIWDINETKVVDWVQTSDLITALTFSPDKNQLLVGFFKGTVKIYRIDQGKLKFVMEVTCKNAFSWGKVNKTGKKVTAITFTEDCEFLVMTNDSRMRLIDSKTYETKVKYKGHSSGKYHIQPSYNQEKELILCGSEDGKVYIWNRSNDYVPQINAGKKNRNTSYESFKPFSKANTTCAVWLPFKSLKMYKERVLSIWKDVYVDNLMVLFSSDSRIKILGNLIEIGQVPPEA